MAQNQWGNAYTLFGGRSGGNPRGHNQVQPIPSYIPGPFSGTLVGGFKTTPYRSLELSRTLDLKKGPLGFQPPKISQPTPKKPPRGPSAGLSLKNPKASLIGPHAPAVPRGPLATMRTMSETIARGDPLRPIAGTKGPRMFPAVKKKPVPLPRKRIM
nr:hypothetical protein [Salmonid herpesvirus 1]